jgi:hypothetical protein
VDFNFSHEDQMLNRKLLHEMITKYPEQHNQEVVFINNDLSRASKTSPTTIGDYSQNCGTRACVVGWTLLLALNPEMPVMEAFQDHSDTMIASLALGVDHEEICDVYGMDKEDAVAWVEGLATRGRYL